jgi:hypothetical protein
MLDVDVHKLFFRPLDLTVKMLKLIVDVRGLYVYVEN